MSVEKIQITHSPCMITKTSRLKVTLIYTAQPIKTMECLGRPIKRASKKTTLLTEEAILRAQR